MRSSSRRAGGRVDIVLESNNVACVSVRDTGPGIARDFLPRIFDRFTQADSSTTRMTGGLGVGLSLVRELVERHGGEIQARNRETGGAEFVVRLPLHMSDQSTRPSVPMLPIPTIASAPLDGVRVLLLDRDEDVRDLLSVVLQQRGAFVRVAASVDQALGMLESWRPDVLVSDALSPERDSYALVTDEDMRRMLRDVKRDLPKPVEPAVLTAEIARLTGRERRRRVRR